MITWRRKRQALYILIVILILGIPTGAYVYVTRPASSCFDGLLSPGELQIDCGGICNAVCKEEVAPLSVIWRKAVPVRQGVYDLAALVENPNPFIAAQEFSYKFEVYDKWNNLLTSITGKSHANPRARFIVFEPNVTLSGEPVRIFFETREILWERKSDFESRRVEVKNENLSLIPTPRLSANIRNDFPEDLRDVEIVATVSSDLNNIVAISSTFITNLPRDEEREVFFTWPEKFLDPPRVCLTPLDVMLLFDRSGSMNDDGLDPPQPITDAKNAAITFLNNLSSRDRAGLVSFGTTASDPIDQPLTVDHSSVRNSISRIAITSADETGSTNLGDGIEKAFEEFIKNPADISGAIENDTLKVAVVLTDGKANAPGGVDTGEAHAAAQAARLHAEGIDVYAVGLGDGVNQGFLSEEIASRKNTYFFSATSAELSSIYSDIAKRVCPDRVYLTDIFIRVPGEIAK